MFGMSDAKIDVEKLECGFQQMLMAPAPTYATPYIVIPPVVRHPLVYLMVAKTMMKWVEDYYHGHTSEYRTDRWEWRVETRAVREPNDRG